MTKKDPESESKIMIMLLENIVDQDCDLNLSLSKKIPVVFHTLKTHHSHLIFQEIKKYNFEMPY